MTLIEFRDQIERFKKRFGEKAFDEEFIKLVWREVKDMPAHAFERTADVMIGARKHTDPPRVTDFREARLNAQKNAFDREVAGAANILRHPTLSKPLAEVLKRDFGAVDSVKDALEIARLRIKTKDRE